MFHTFFTKYKRPIFYAFCKVAADGLRRSYFEPQNVPMHPLSDPARLAEAKRNERIMKMGQQAREQVVAETHSHRNEFKRVVRNRPPATSANGGLRGSSATRKRKGRL